MSFNLKEGFGSNETAEVEGVWVELGEDGAVKVAKLSNQEAQRAYRRIPRAIRRQIEDGVMSNLQSKQFLAKFMSENILRDWRNLIDGKTKLPKYTPEEGMKKLLKHPRFRDRVWELSIDDDLFNIDEEEDLKN